ncbi:MAG: hypothetical protein IKU84_02015 [Clostridia bacterium]|nr:hypothetical protein [Clostridia bacterium]
MKLYKARRNGFSKKTPKKSNSFEKAFIERLGKTPAEFIHTKLSAGSDKKAVEYLYDIVSVEIVRENNCTPIPFEKLYEMVSRKAKEQKRVLESEQEISRKIKLCQREYLNNVDGRPFGGLYAGQMDLLYGDNEVCNKIIQIGKEYSSVEFCDNAAKPDFLEFKRETLPKRMKELGITENPIVQSICEKVIRGGKSPKSALITIYYAIRSYLLKTEGK